MLSTIYVMYMITEPLSNSEPYHCLYTDISRINKISGTQRGIKHEEG